MSYLYRNFFLYLFVVKDSMNTLNHHIDSTNHQRPLFQPCTRTEINTIITNNHHKQFDATTDDVKLLSSTKNQSSTLNNAHRSDTSMRSITKSI